MEELNPAIVGIRVAILHWPPWLSVFVPEHIVGAFGRRLCVDSDSHRHGRWTVMLRDSKRE